MVEPDTILHYVSHLYGGGPDDVMTSTGSRAAPGTLSRRLPAPPSAAPTAGPTELARRLQPYLQLLHFSSSHD